MNDRDLVLPNLAWYLSISAHQHLSPRCPYASASRCPRFYQSLSLLGSAGNTQIAQNKDDKLKKSWEKTDIWPITAEQATSISGPKNEDRHFSNFCPEVSYERFGFFATELHKYVDDIDVRNSYEALRREEASPDDWRWKWCRIEPMHYTECPLYSLINLEEVRKKVDGNTSICDKIIKHPFYITIAFLGSIASLIGLWYTCSQENSKNQVKIEIHQEAPKPNNPPQPQPEQTKHVSKKPSSYPKDASPPLTKKQPDTANNKQGEEDNEKDNGFESSPGIK